MLTPTAPSFEVPLLWTSTAVAVVLEMRWWRSVECVAVSDTDVLENTIQLWY